MEGGSDNGNEVETGGGNSNEEEVMPAAEEADIAKAKSEGGGFKGKRSRKLGRIFKKNKYFQRNDV